MAGLGKVLSYAEKAQIRRLRKRDVRAAEIARKLGRPVTTICSFLSRESTIRRGVQYRYPKKSQARATLESPVELGGKVEESTYTIVICRGENVAKALLRAAGDLL